MHSRPILHLHPPHPLQLPPYPLQIGLPFLHQLPMHSLRNLVPARHLLLPLIPQLLPADFEPQLQILDGGVLLLVDLFDGGLGGQEGAGVAGVRESWCCRRRRGKLGGGVMEREGRSGVGAGEMGRGHAAVVWRRGVDNGCVGVCFSKRAVRMGKGGKKQRSTEGHLLVALWCSIARAQVL